MCACVFAHTYSLRALYPPAQGLGLEALGLRLRGLGLVAPLALHPLVLYPLALYPRALDRPVPDIAQACVCLVRLGSPSCQSQSVPVAHQVAMPAPVLKGGLKKKHEQLTPGEMQQIDDIIRKEKGKQIHALRAVNAERMKAKRVPLNKGTISRYVGGKSHRRGVQEKRGAKRKLSTSDMKRLEQSRRRLIKRADGETRVTYADVIEEADLDKDVSQRTIENSFRESGVAYRKPREKIQISEDDAKKRFVVAKDWVKRPASYWKRKVHAYVDNKAFPLPLTPAQRKKFKQTRVSGHLRKPGEGTQRGFTKPRQKHSWIGFPSVTISAAVAKDKMIMWSVVEGSWNGQAAADMYKGPLKSALRRTWGNKRRYTIVEDGDLKGNQSGKGVRAKEAVGIIAMTLPPRSPCWMPLDYNIWDAIIDKLMDESPEGHETKADFLERLKKTALSLPTGYIAKQIAKMRPRIQGVIDAEGRCPKCD